MTLRMLLECLNADHDHLTENQLAQIAKMIAKYPVLQSWNLNNLA